MHISPITAFWIMIMLPLLVPLYCVLGAEPGFKAWRYFRNGLFGCSLVTAIGSLICTLFLIAAVLETKTLKIPPFFYLDALSLFFILIINLVFLAATLYLDNFLGNLQDIQGQQKQIRKDKNEKLPKALAGLQELWPRPFHALFSLFHLAMVLCCTLDNLVYLWISLQTTTVISALLVAFRRDRQALEAAWKYALLASMGIVFAFLGTVFLALELSEAGSFTLNWSELVQNLASLEKGRLDQGLIKTMFWFVLIGYGIKAGFAPFHTWLPDAHGRAPFPISAVLSGVLLKCALFAILRYAILVNKALGDDGRFTFRALFWLGLFSLALSTPFIIKNDNSFKRVLAYHSLEHMGIIAFGIGLGSKGAVFAGLLHALNHALTKAMMFLAYGQVFRCYLPCGLRRPYDFLGLMRSMPLTAAILGLGGLALVGSPPFSVFYSEFSILWAAVKIQIDEPSGLLLAGLIVFLLSVIFIFGGLVRHLGWMLTGFPPGHEFAKVSRDAFEHQEGLVTSLSEWGVPEKDVTVKPRPEGITLVWPLFALLAIITIMGVWIPAPLSKLLDMCVVVVRDGAVP